MTLQTEPKVVTYDTGEVVRCRVDITIKETGAHVDPGGLKFYTRLKSGTEIIYTYGVDAQLVRESMGKYYVDVDTGGNNGPDFYRFEGSGANKGANDHSFIIAKTPAKTAGV